MANFTLAMPRRSYDDLQLLTNTTHANAYHRSQSQPAPGQTRAIQLGTWPIPENEYVTIAEDEIETALEALKGPDATSN